MSDENDDLIITDNGRRLDDEEISEVLEALLGLRSEIATGLDSIEKAIDGVIGKTQSLVDNIELIREVLDGREEAEERRQNFEIIQGGKAE